MHQALTITYFIALMVYAFARLAAFYQAKPRKLPWSAYWSDGLAALGEIWLLWIAFKEASTRSDGHVILFLPFMFYMAARLLVVAYPSVKRRTVYYAWVAACFTIMSAIILWTVPPLLHTTKRLYAKSTIKNIAWVEVAHQYDYAYFKQERYSSQQAFSGLVRDVAGLRDSLASYAKGTGIKSPKLVGYTNTIFYLPAITNNYTYAPFLQTYQAFPTTLFDKLYMQYLVSHPQTLVFWSNLNPSIDGRMPSGDLPKTFQYLHDDYSVVASYHGLYVLAKSANPNKIVDASSCKVITINSYTNTPTALASGAKSISVNLHELSRLPIDTLYKKPVYQIFLYNDMGQVQIYRTTPSLLKAGINTDPLLPSLISPSSRVNRIMVSASDEREASLTITQRVCAP